MDKKGYDYKGYGMDDNDIAKYAPHIDKLQDHGITNDQLGAIFDTVASINDMDTVEVGNAVKGKAIDQLMSEYSDYVRNADYDKATRLGYIKELINSADDPESAEEQFSVFM